MSTASSAPTTWVATSATSTWRTAGRQTAEEVAGAPRGRAQQGKDRAEEVQAGAPPPAAGAPGLAASVGAIARARPRPRADARRSLDHGGGGQRAAPQASPRPRSGHGRRPAGGPVGSDTSSAARASARRRARYGVGSARRRAPAARRSTGSSAAGQRSARATAGPVGSARPRRAPPARCRRIRAASDGHPRPGGLRRRPVRRGDRRAGGSASTGRSAIRRPRRIGRSGTSTNSSRRVGPGSSRTLSATESYRSEVVRYSTWKSRARSRSSSAARRARASSKVTNGSSKMSGGPLLLGHLAHEAQSRREIDLVERAPGQLLDRHPVAGLRRPDPERQVLLVDLRPAGSARR